MAELYRGAYSLGRNTVTVEAFFAYATSSGFWIKYLKLPSNLVQQSVVQTLKVEHQSPNFSRKSANSDSFSYQMFGSSNTPFNNNNDNDNVIIELTNDDCNNEYNIFISTFLRMKSFLKPLF